MNADCLIAAGIDYKSGVERLLGNVDFYERLLNVFLRDDTMEKAEAALVSKDYSALFSCAHDLKGSSGNMSMTPLYNASNVLCELLRAKPYSDDKIIAAYDGMSKAYQDIKNAVRCALEN